ncbi:TIR domain-containing protein [Streptomyces sp. Ag109_O5-1]|nr:TIR domain-containing protein [Streptomyces sp. Ag109_O5-1]
MKEVFINYRTGDGEKNAALIDQELSRRFGPQHVFRASRSIAPGEAYPDSLLTALRRSYLLLAVVGPDWTNFRTRLHDPEDWVRREIDSQLRALGIRRSGQHGLRPGHRKHHLSFGVLAPPTLLHKEIEYCLPCLHRGARNTYVRQRPHQVRVEEAPHVIPQQVGHPAMLPGSPGPSRRRGPARSGSVTRSRRMTA